MSETETGRLHSLQVSVRYRLTTPFKWMCWKKILFKDFSEFLDILVESQPCGRVKSANETQFMRIGYKAIMIGQQAREGFLTVNTCDRKMDVIVDYNI